MWIAALGSLDLHGLWESTRIKDCVKGVLQFFEATFWAQYNQTCDGIKMRKNILIVDMENLPLCNVTDKGGNRPFNQCNNFKQHVSVHYHHQTCIQESILIANCHNTSRPIILKYYIGHISLTVIEFQYYWNQNYTITQYVSNFVNSSQDFLYWLDNN